MNPHQGAAAWQLSNVDQNPASMGLMAPANLERFPSKNPSASVYSTQDIPYSQAGASQLTQDFLCSSQNDGSSLGFHFPMSFRDQHRYLDGVFNSHSDPDSIPVAKMRIISREVGLSIEEICSWFEDEQERRVKLLACTKETPSRPSGTQFPPSPAETTTPPQNSTVTLCMSHFDISPQSIVPRTDDIFSPPPLPSGPLQSRSSVGSQPVPAKAKRGRPAKARSPNNSQAPASPNAKRLKRTIEYPCPDCNQVYPAERWLDHVRRVHFPDQIWECQQMNPRTNLACIYNTTPRADNFGNHLKTEHGCDDAQIAQLKKSSKFKVFNLFHHKCGFCEETLTSRDQSIDHIKDHLKEISQRAIVPADLGLSEWKEQCGVSHVLTKGVHYGLAEDSEADAPGDDDDDNSGSGSGPRQDTPDDNQDEHHNQTDGAPDSREGNGGDGSFEDGGYSSQEHGFSMFGQLSNAAQDSIDTPTKPTSTMDNKHSSFGLEAFTAPFLFVRRLGSGGHGSVDEVTTASSVEHFVRKSVVRKKQGTIPSSDMTHLKNELSILKELSHPNLVKLVGAYTDDECSHIIMTPVADQNLSDLMRSTPPHTSHQVLNWMNELCSALSYLHSRQVKHLDIKPQNILVKDEHLLLADFGTARSFFGRPSDHADSIAITPMYCAPETIELGQQDYSADVFSLGCVFAEMLTHSTGKTIEEFEQFRAVDDKTAFHLTSSRTRIWLDALAEDLITSFSEWKELVLLLYRMLSPLPDERPSAQIIQNSFTVARLTPQTQINVSDSPQSHENDRTVFEPHTTSHPTKTSPSSNERAQPTEYHRECDGDQSSDSQEAEPDLNGHTAHLKSSWYTSNAFERTFKRTYSALPFSAVPSLYSGSSSVPDSDSDMTDAGTRWGYPSPAVYGLVPTPSCDAWSSRSLDLWGSPDIMSQRQYSLEYSAPPSMEDFPLYPKPGFVDPSLLHPEYHSLIGNNSTFEFTPYPPSPALSQTTAGTTSNNFSPSYSPFTFMSPPPIRRPSTLSKFRTDSYEFNDLDSDHEKGCCPVPGCRKVYKDLKAHMLTHTNERPEKCPIQACDYHVKGFARKYDKNRHTLTHYKGTMVCGFCPGSGSAAEKSFNRADVFKRHLTSVHGVEQTPPNSRKKSPLSSNEGKARRLTGYAPDATGKCSTCSSVFSNAQDFYEHLDDCVLRIVQQEEPSEAINAARLAEVEQDTAVLDTLQKHAIPTTTSEDNDKDEEDENEDEEDDDDFSLRTRARKKLPPIDSLHRGLTHSKGGVTLNTKGRKKRKDYPSSWGLPTSQMKMKKRVLCVFDGPRRLWKDDMRLDSEYEARSSLISDSKAYVTDLDIQTLRRADFFHNGTKEDQGPLIADELTGMDLEKLMEAKT